VTVFDEFQEVLALDPHLPAVMRSIFQHQTEVSHVFLGSRHHLIDRVFNDQNEPMYRMAMNLPLPPIGPEEFGPFIQAQLARTGLEIAPSALDLILTTTVGHPHDTQQLCHFTWQATREAGVRTAGVAQVERAIAAILDAESARFTDLWDALTLPLRAFLAVLASGRGRAIFSEEFRRTHGLGSASTVQHAVSQLTERQLIEGSTRAGYRVADPFFRAWIERLARG
jgi:hypothetical protein